MKLKHIKLAGFKSFVDPTTVALPSNLVAVVGPNGCGKSNIIDAICWVMGESSAKYLRGESLTDVIFNGSSARKPVGQATVELLFDNQDGSLGGEYSNYAEISIRRTLSRDGQSVYFLNGTRCRRKDVIDIFLGTGLGPRSYSIIGQNMISRVIEAKPEELRVYLEEAAGVSKYKERRRETENRISHTRENLARLNDVRSELEKQLTSLKRQANAAEKFKVLMEEERVVRAQYQAVQWRDFDERLSHYHLQIQQQETQLEAQHAELQRIDRNTDQLRDKQHNATEVANEIQRRYYVAGNDITQIEQEIRYTEERRQQWQMDLAQVENEWQTATQNVQRVEQQISELTQMIAQLTPEASQAVGVAQDSIQSLTQAEEKMQDWQIRWDDFHHHSARATQTAQVEQTKIQHLEQQLENLAKRRQKFVQEEINFGDLETEIHHLQQRADTIGVRVVDHEAQMGETQNHIHVQKQAHQQIQSQLDTLHVNLQRVRGQHASLEALQQAALGQKNQQTVQWLAKHQLAELPRLAQEIEVEAGWERAVETVLGTFLQAVCVDDVDSVSTVIESLTQGSLCLLAAQSNAVNHARTTLASKVSSAKNLTALLGNVFVADSLAEALQKRHQLQAHESVITADGIWLGQNWLRVARDENQQAGILQREQELKQLEKQLSQLEAEQEKFKEQIAESKQALSNFEQQREQQFAELNHCKTQLAEANTEQRMKKARLAELQAQAQQLNEEQLHCLAQIEQAQQELVLARTVWQQAIAEAGQHAEMREHLLTERDVSRDALQTARQKANSDKDIAHQLELRLNSCKTQLHSITNNFSHLQNHVQSLTERKAHLVEQLAVEAPLHELQRNLESALEKRLSIESELNVARTHVTALEHEVRNFEKERHEVEQLVASVRDELEKKRLDSEGLKVKSQALEEQIQTAGFVLETVIQELPEDCTADQWKQNLDELTLRIARLGPINLVAIEEFATCSERKQYLDEQYNDLQQGLTTLEDAINKIDKETRERFKETFDKVSQSFQELFPKIFGGGSASLTLEGESLLDAGITVMACPPGKRNSTIHLLSGGEKALTAIALVFSIFQLNPAPFCLLDEVDAPLDDANISRFCNLVHDMAQKTQFIFISHNKLAIEMAHHLTGVTMHEPGVSRLVAVDVEEAISMAQA